MGLARKAILYTLLIHVVVLGAMVWVPVSDELPASETFTEVSMVDAEEVVAEPEQSFEAQLRASMEAKVANLLQRSSQVPTAVQPRQKSRRKSRRNCKPWRRPNLSDALP